jgi:pimeloyl-ACP methyl ester carboxylesterase
MERRNDQQMETTDQRTMNPANPDSFRMNTSVERPEGGFQPAPSSSRYVAAGGARLRYLDYGAAGRPPILCVHGGAAHAHWYDFFAPGFTGDYHVHSLDLRGHGDSEWMDPPDYTYEVYISDVDEVMQRLALRDVVLVGHSMGGLVSLLYTATHPERIRALIVVDSSVRMPEDRAAMLRDVGSRPGSRYASRDEFVSRYRLRPGGTSAAPEIVRHLAERGARQLPDGHWTHKFDRNVYAQRNGLDGVPYWGRIRVPALLVKGSRSQRITPEILADVRTLCPHVEFAEVPHSEHHIFLDNPRGFERAVKAFLARL